MTLRVSSVEEDERSVLLRFEVQDTGIGIAPEDQARLFKIFEQVDNSSSRRYGGIGAGLAMTKKIANLMGGDAGCSSRVGEGSRFWFTARLGRPNAVVAREGHATLRGLRVRQPRRLVLAVPVAAPDSIAALRSEVDDIVCLQQPAPFYAIGQFYADFHQLSDDEVIRLLAAPAEGSPPGEQPGRTGGEGQRP